MTVVWEFNAASERIAFGNGEPGVMPQLILIFIRRERTASARFANADRP